MTTLVMAVLGAGVGLGLLLVICGLSGQHLFGLGQAAALRQRVARFSTRSCVAIIAAAATASVTRWPVAGVLAAAGAWGGPYLLGGRQIRERNIARTEAIASWTEMVRDSIVAASGLEEAIVATGGVAPEPIATEVRTLVRRLDHQPLPDALVEFGRDLQHPSGDLVVTALVLASEMEASDLSGLLTRLAEATRGEARMRIRVEVGRARVRTASKVILGVVGATVLLLGAVNRGYLAVYGDSTGQLALLVIGSIFGFGGWLMTKMAAIDLPERFTARTATRPTEVSA